VKIYTDFKKFKPVSFPVVTIGTFDGVHIGHQKIFKRLKEVAQKNNGETIVITFNPHPRLVLEPNNTELKFINTQKKKFELLEKAGVDHLIVLPFTKEFATISSKDFIKSILVDKLKAKIIIVGYDHHFGRERRGSFKVLRGLAKIYDFEVEEIPAQDIINIAVSSTKIRKALFTGDIKKANILLGYEYSITGIVVRGKQIGRKIGFPTANINLDDHYKLIAANGVYACKVEWNNKIYKGMGNIGFRPTLNENGLTIEVNIFDFDEDIYDEIITIYFIDRFRDEKKFKNLDFLRRRLMIDRYRTLQIFDEYNK
jgi:riboflavin kinase / FMN adenylyltransferase